MTATPMTGFVIEAMRNIELEVIGFFESRSIVPCAEWCTTLPLRATIVTAPARSPAAMRRSIIWLMRARRSEDRPTSSGFAVGEAVNAGKLRTVSKSAQRTAVFMDVSCRRTWRTNALNYGRGVAGVQQPQSG